ncbi:MAG: hypothetical protein EOP47_27820 [Sphingobacteriaceae bacterium]|nr:MAG: hypothetical protein EOP47_27820 [Sphingobacteriaceae bacterium]
MKLSHCIIALAVLLHACKKANTPDKPIPDPIIPIVPVDTVKKLEFTWAKSFGGTGVEGILDMATDDAGNVYLTGKFKGMVDFDLGAGVQNLTAGGDNATYFAKYNTNGVLVFVKDITVIGVNYVAMGGDATGNVYFAGNFTGKVDIDKGPAVQKLDSKGGVDVFVVKYDTGGNVLSKFIIGNSGNESVAGLAVDRTGNCYLAGTSNYVIDVDPGTTVKNVNRPKCFLAK